MPAVRRAGAAPRRQAPPAHASARLLAPPPIPRLRAARTAAERGGGGGGGAQAAAVPRRGRGRVKHQSQPSRGRGGPTQPPVPRDRGQDPATHRAQRRAQPRAQSSAEEPSIRNSEQLRGAGWYRLTTFSQCRSPCAGTGKQKPDLPTRSATVPTTPQETTSRAAASAPALRPRALGQGDPAGAAPRPVGFFTPQ